MTSVIETIGDIADQFDAIVLDQWGVLHDGRTAYPGALAAVADLNRRGIKLGVLSNSGKRASPNAARIGSMGFEMSTFAQVMTSGEALWLLFEKGDAPNGALYPIEGKEGDAAAWKDGLSIKLTTDLGAASAILLMGLPDGSTPDAYDTILSAGIARDLPLYCSNPDLKSPRGNGTFVMSPGVLARRYEEMGGTTHLFGKPHLPIYKAMQDAVACDPARILMVGDSMHHDILGAQTAGWHSLLICAGVHAPDIEDTFAASDIVQLAAAEQMPPPDYAIHTLR